MPFLGHVTGVAQLWPVAAHTNHLHTLSQLAAEFPDIRGNPVHDMHTVVLMREHGITQICTNDSDFRRFPFLEIVNPLQ